MRKLSAENVAAVAYCCVSMSSAIGANPLAILHAMAHVAGMENEDRDAIHDYLYGYRHQTIYHIPRRSFDGESETDRHSG